MPHVSRVLARHGKFAATYVSALDDQFSSSLLLVIEIKLEVEQAYSQNNQQRRCDASVKTWQVCWPVLTSENQTASNAANAAKSDQRGTAESTLPLAANVVGLVGHDLWDVAVGASTGEKDAKVASSHAVGPAHNGQTNDCEKSIEDDQRTTDVILIADPSGAKHDDSGKCIRGCNLKIASALAFLYPGYFNLSYQTLRCSNAEAHSNAEDEWQEEGEGIRHGCDTGEDKSESPNLNVEACRHELAKVKGLQRSVATVSVDAGDDEAAFFVSQEAFRLAAIIIWESDKENVTENGHNTCQDSFPDENPLRRSAMVHVIDG